MKILLFGKNGQLGWELQRSLAPLGELIALDRKGTVGLTGDLSDADGLRVTIQTVKPDMIVNAAAYTAVDKAEEDTGLADSINRFATEVIAQEAETLGCCFVHYSTDYVFDGTGETPWCETDVINPINQYGLSKAKGEQAILESGCRHLIFRASWVYGAHGNNFIKTMLHLMSNREELSVVGDQVGAPIGAELLADVSAHAIRQVTHAPELSGVYHVAPDGETNWYQYAVFIAAQARKCGMSLKVKDIHSILTSEYPTPAKRPLNSRLNTHKLRRVFGLYLPDWQQGVSRAIHQIMADLR
ncbi:dTDP-4-dehydrorhamnose reductase [Desulfosediminicola flagellatus]|uniref:dTDP-4-dehydrorhamnose reductase n=1 Tax=Desulfosediminicola flagellatus TaxID=2569541 RepID=UPI0010AD220A|nr:dTDP-4-dehydrorhamnose reductase [Desulfosediminicola flagellatus]